MRFKEQLSVARFYSLAQFEFGHLQEPLSIAFIHWGSSTDLKVRTTLYSMIKVPHENTAQYFSFEWSHTRVWSRDLKKEIPLHELNTA